MKYSLAMTIVIMIFWAMAPCCPYPDSDGDGTGDMCDQCPNDPDKIELGECGCNMPDIDSDKDGLVDCKDSCTDLDNDGYGNPGYELNTCEVDNCPDLANPDQKDSDGDGKGDVCEVFDNPFFLDISVPSNIQDENYDPNPVKPIPINDHSRLGFADINGDGYDDIVMHSLFPNPMNGGIPFEHLVFLNNGNKTFTNFSDESGLRNIQAGFFAFGDVDNDGDLDCFAGFDYQSSSNRHTLLMNDGQGHFTVKANSGLEGTYNNAVAGNAVFGDFNGDGKLDIYLGNGQTMYAATDQLFFGNGDGTFSDKSINLPGNPARPSNGVVACDYDNDGDLDIFVSVYGVSIDNGHNILWENNGNGLFRNVAEERGFAYLTTGNYYLDSTGYGQDDEPKPYLFGSPIGSNGFGLDCQDINNDGYLDIFVTAISHPVSTDYKRKWSDPTTLLINKGPAGNFAFVNEFLKRHLPFNEGDVDGAIADFDNDGLSDLSISRDIKYESGYPEDEVEQKSWFGLMHQNLDGSFESLGLKSGINDVDDAVYVKMKGAQNHAWSDIDNDGDLDLLVGGRKSTTPGVGRPNFLFENLIGSKNNWLALRLIGDGSKINHDAIGARVTLRYRDRMIVREVKSSRGTYNSMDSRALHFGLGDFDGDYSVTVRWPDKSEKVYTSADIERNGYTTLRYAK
jgi:hypothetical protein